MLVPYRILSNLSMAKIKLFHYIPIPELFIPALLLLSKMMYVMLNLSLTLVRKLITYI